MAANPLKTVDTFLRRFDGYQRNNRRAGFLFAVIKKYNEDEAGHRAALLAYYGFLALFPMLLVATTVLKLVLRNEPHLRDQIIQGGITYFPIVGHDLQASIHGISHTGVALVAGVLLTLYGARGVADVMRGGLDHIWHVPYARRSAFPGNIIRSMVIVVVGGLGLALAPVISGYAYVFGHGEIIRVAAAVITLVVLFLILVFVIKVGTSASRPIREIWVGAAVAAVGLGILQSLGGVIVAHEMRHLNSLYGTFAIVLGLLYWLYLQSTVLFFIFELDSVRVLKLWPRSLQKPLTPADHQAFKLYANRAVFHDSEDL